ncbi:MAG: membrane protein insertase YidC [Flavobacteriales bacterium]|nr:membrane protein insertase YidC [Flavobacteriales bacterium]
MEEKKLDLNSIIGFVLIFVILLYVMYTNQPTPEELKKEQTTEQKAVEDKVNNDPKGAVVAEVPAVVSDSLALVQAQSKLGAFAYSSVTAKEGETILENDVLRLTIANKGGYITEATVKGFERIKKGSGELVQIIKDNNAQLDIELQTLDNKLLHTKDLVFEPTLTEADGNQILSLKLKTSETSYLEYSYVLKPKEYMLDFTVRTQGLSGVLNSSKSLQMNWNMETYRNEKSVSSENRYTELIYEFDGGKDDYLGQSKSDEEEVSNVTYVAFKQHFFSSILLTDTPFEKVQLKSENLVQDQTVDTLKTKRFAAQFPLAFKGGEVNYNMNWYYGPSDYKILNSYDRNLDEVISLGWGLFGWINKYLFIPVFGFLSGLISNGLAIVFFTIIVRLLMSPGTYKSYLSQAKMKIIRPEMAELNEKFKKDPMKKQQETMKLYSKAGVNPMAGCIPALLQIPVFYALFQLFPSAIALRQTGFLWADDLSSYDSILELPFSIPFYGNHISLFPILASVAIFFYMKMTTGDQVMSQPQQEGMPDMASIMKMMIYISPIMMLLFFNSYASGLSLYYFISNLITIGIMFVIKNYIIDENKLHAQIEENKKQPKKKGKFQKKMQELMEEAERQQKLKNNK